MKKLILLTIVLTCFLTSYCFALDLHAAKAQGLVGEKPSGYLGVVKEQSGVSDLVQDINNKRKAKYSEIAKANGTSLSSVEKHAGQKAIAKTSSGNFYLNSAGVWLKK